MDPEFWQKRWDAQQIGFHQSTVNPYLERHLARLTGGLPSKVLVPLCGKSRDMTYLAAQGHKVVGVEVVVQAVEAFYAEQGVAPSRERAGNVERFEAAGVEILCGNFFDVTVARLGGVSVVFDRAALIAMPKDARAVYARHLLSLVTRGGRVLLVTLEYDDTKMSGPPFSVPTSEVTRLFGGHCDVALLEEGDVLASNERYRARGIEALVERAFLLTVK